MVDGLANAARSEIANVTTIFLGLAVGSRMTGAAFIRVETLAILGLGLFAFVLDMAGGILFGKLLYILSGKKFNPLIGSAGISAFPHVGARRPADWPGIRHGELPAHARHGRECGRTAGKRRRRWSRAGDDYTIALGIPARGSIRRSQRNAAPMHLPASTAGSWRTSASGFRWHVDRQPISKPARRPKNPSAVRSGQ